MNLILTRHGETIENIKKIYQGQKIQGTLSKLGIEQAKKLALRLKDEKIDYIYSSDLARALDTAKEIAKFHQDIPLILVKELRERASKTLAGKHTSEIDFKNLPTDTETRADMRKRVKKLLDQVYEKCPDKTILFVGHAGINKSLIRVILNKPDDYNLDHQFNTAVNIFEIKEDKNHKIICLNCTKHLK
ncbi:MAG: histidine phosphatase family protein [Candidatus Woesearchaeota archaeon]